MKPSAFDSESLNDRLCVIGEVDPFIARLLRRFAEKSGLRTKRAQTGEAVLQLVEREKPRVIILDPELPGRLRGWEVYRQIKENSEMSGIPLVICTWLEGRETWILIGRQAVVLQKPDLHYDGFAAALAATGFTK
jgi:DNA-binding response OmpR family regulator